MALTAGTNFYMLLPSPRNSISFSLSFEGNIPQHLTNSEVPVELSIYLLPEFSSLRPIIQTIHAQSEQAQTRRENEVRPRHMSPSVMQRINAHGLSQMGVIPMPFLPISLTFNKTSAEAWSSLASQIQQWLIFCLQDEGTPHWKWGVEVFWVAFVASYPSFPLGEWPLWDSRIPMAGPFIEKQLAVNDFKETSWKAVELISEDMARKRRKELWEEFCTIVRVLYPYPIQDVEITA